LLWKHKRERIEELKKDFTKKSVMDKIFHVLDFPFEWARKLTIPPSDEDYDNWLVVVWPFFGIPVAGMIILKSWPTTWYWVLTLIPSIIWAIY